MTPNEGLTTFIIFLGIICACIFCAWSFLSLFGLVPGIVPTIIDLKETKSFQPPQIGSLIDEDSIITPVEKWRQWIGGKYYFSVKLSNGRTIYTSESVYYNLTIGQTGIGRGYESFISPETELMEFYPVNVTHYGDIRGQLWVIP